MADEEKPKPAAAKPKPKAPPPPPPEDSPIFVRLKELRPEAIAEGSELYRGDLSVRLKPESLVETLEFLRDHPEFRCDYLVSLAAVDYPERPKRFDVVYTLHSIPLNLRFNVVVEVGEEEELASVSEVWKTADWQERECYDLFGIRFVGHPDLRRILMPDWWEGYPLRKDYPVEGRGEQERVVEEALRPREED